jgi:hypothetical protein
MLVGSASSLKLSRPLVPGHQLSIAEESQRVATAFAQAKEVILQAGTGMESSDSVDQAMKKLRGVVDRWKLVEDRLRTMVLRTDPNYQVGRRAVPVSLAFLPPPRSLTSVFSPP